MSNVPALLLCQCLWRLPPLPLPSLPSGCSLGYPKHSGTAQLEADTGPPHPQTGPLPGRCPGPPKGLRFAATARREPFVPPVLLLLFPAVLWSCHLQHARGLAPLVSAQSPLSLSAEGAGSRCGQATCAGGALKAHSSGCERHLQSISYFHLWLLSLSPPPCQVQESSSKLSGS